MNKVCLSWIDSFDLKRFAEKSKDHGTLIAFLKSEQFSDIDELHVLLNKKTKYSEFADRFVKYAKGKYCQGKKVVFHEFDLQANNFTKIFAAISKLLRSIASNAGESGVKFYFQVGPGTQKTTVCWVLLSQTIYPAVLIMTSLDKNSGQFNTTVYNDPSRVDAALFASIIKNSDAKLLEAWTDIPEYSSIIHKSAVMRELLSNAHKMAIHDVPVLILGESGTGKELFAKAIHKSSRRADKPLKTLNCAAIGEATANATLFGWSRGAWTGSVGEGRGYFVECDGGTIFLDEIGDLSMETQTALLRTIQSGEVQRVGDGKVFKTDVRIITATNRDLRKLVSENKFREDLFYRIDVGILKLPPLRERLGDAAVIAEYFIELINIKNKDIVNYYIPKAFAKPALKYINEYHWPGNVRELYNTIQRACMWHDGELIGVEDFAKYISEPPGQPPKTKQSTEVKLDKPVDLAEITNSIKKNYIMKALEVCHGNKVAASKLLGYKNYQTLSNEIKKLGV